MVFESMVVDVLNRIIGDYVVNLDSSQLKLGIWGGDAVLTNLEIKENILSKFDIPCRVRAGHIGQLALKIPWKNLYTQSVEATLDGVYLLVVPTASVKYDAEKEEKQLLEARQRELQRIEETKMRAAEQENPEADKQDTYMEKMVTQVIKNLQVIIGNIHIRYEDDISCPNCPLSFGVSLENLSLQTADENWNPSILNENSRLFYKLVQLDNLYSYWNVNSVIFSNSSTEEALLSMKKSTELDNSLPVSHDCTAAKLRMNPRSDVNFSTPNVEVIVSLSEVVIELGRHQYVSFLEVLGSVDVMSRNLPYRKYRPEVPVHENARSWWQYAITGTLEVDVKPQLQMWSWQKIFEHRQMVKSYKKHYKMKITQKTPSEDVIKELEPLESKLDLFNITLARQQAEMEASRAGLCIYRRGLRDEDEDAKGWFGWMWNWGEDNPNENEPKSTGFDDLWTSDEKAKLHTAIGYSEASVNHNLPKEFEDTRVNFHMERLSLSFQENKNKSKNEIMRLTVGELISTLTQRPGAQAIKITAQLSFFEVTGLSINRSAPTLLSSREATTGTGTPLLSLLFETNPLDESANQRLHVESLPLEIIYDAVTVNSMSAFVVPPEHLQLDDLTSVTLMKLEQFRDRTATGLMYVIETQKVLDLNINLMASYVIIPQTGFYDATQNLMLLDLGNFKVSSQSKKDLPQLSISSSNMEDIMSRAYHSFDVHLSSLQFLYSKPDENWKQARKQKKSTLHILEPVDINVLFSRAMFVKDSRMAKYKISGELPLLSVQISDDKVRGVLELIDSIPLPESRTAVHSMSSHTTPKPYIPKLRKPRTVTDQLPSMVLESCEGISIGALGVEEELPKETVMSQDANEPQHADAAMSLCLSKSEETKREEEHKNLTDLIVVFEINQLSVQLCRMSWGHDVTVLHLDIEGLRSELIQRTSNMTTNACLQQICLKCPEYMESDKKAVDLITTRDKKENHLLTLEYIKADKNGPEFRSLHKNTEQLVKVSFPSLDVHLHTEALLSAMNFLYNLLPPSINKEGRHEDLATIPEEDEIESEVAKDKKTDTAVATRKTSKTLRFADEIPGKMGEERKDESEQIKKKTSKSSKFADMVTLHIRADLRCLKVFIGGQKARISEISIEGVASEVLFRKTEMEILANLKSIIVVNCEKDALYRKAVSIADKEVFALHMVTYTDATQGDAYLDLGKVDTSVTLTVGCIQVIFLNKFLSSMLGFINNFQTAKEALAEASAQAAERAASGVKELAERSTRIALEVHFNAPVIFVPQSSHSINVIVADLGLLSLKNRFALQSGKKVEIPPVVDIMTVKLSDLKMYRTTYDGCHFQGETLLLTPISLNLILQRNLASNWYHHIPDVEVIARLNPINLIFSQDDITVTIKIWNENLSETSDAVPPQCHPHVHKLDSVSHRESQSSAVTAPTSSRWTAAVAGVQNLNYVILKTTLKLDFTFDSMTVVLHRSNGKEHLDLHDEQLKLAEVSLGTISTSVYMYSNNSMKASVSLSSCILEDKRPNINLFTPRMMAMRPGAEKNKMMEINLSQGDDGTILETVIQDVYLCASMEFLLIVADIFLKASEEGYAQAPPTISSAELGERKRTGPVAPVTSPVVSKMEMNIIVQNPEVVFVADLTRGDASALVVTMQCEVVSKSATEGSQMTAIIKELMVVACPFLTEKRTHSVTTVLQPCQVSFRSVQCSEAPQSMQVSIETLTLKVSPITINSIINIYSVLTPTTETPVMATKSVPPNLWERQDWKDLKLWFLEENGAELTQSQTPVIPLGESLQVSIKSICLALEAGVGHRTIPMLLAKASFYGDVKDWTTLIDLQSQLSLEVYYHNEVVGVWEPLLEPIEDERKDGLRPWVLDFKMKRKAVKSLGKSDETDYHVPDYKTVIDISSQDQLNIMLSKCGLCMLTNLGTAFAEAAHETAECLLKDEPPFVVRNCLGLPISVTHSVLFCPTGKQSINGTTELQDGEIFGMDYLATADSDQFSAMTSLSAKDYYIQPTPVGHTSAGTIPLIKVGRRMHSVMHRETGLIQFLVCHIYTVEGSKFITIRSPLQIINHLSIPMKVLDGSRCLGTAVPNEEFCVPLNSYRSQLSLQPVMDHPDNEPEPFDCSEGFCYKLFSNQQSETHLQQTCHSRGGGTGVLIVNLVPLKENISFKNSGDAEENFDDPFVLHLWPSTLLSNLLPYNIAFKLELNGDCTSEDILGPGHSAQLHTAIINQSTLNLRLIDYLGQDWAANYNDQEEFTYISFHTLHAEDMLYDQGTRGEVDIAVHVKYGQGQTVVAIHSPYWMENKTEKLLTYKAGDIQVKHPEDYKMPLLFSLKPQGILQNSKISLIVSNSEHSAAFSLDTVGSSGDVTCKGKYKDYRVGVRIDTSSFSLTRLVSFTPFYLLVNRTNYMIMIREECHHSWTKTEPQQSAIPFWPEKGTKRLKIKVEGSESPLTVDFSQPENSLLLRLDNTENGLIVDVNLSEYCAVIRFSDYHDGAAPFLLINHTKDQIVQFYQSSQKRSQKEELEPGKASYYIWKEPTGSRELCWKCGKYSGKLKSEQDIHKDLHEEGNFFLFSFHEGLQRVVLFTEEHSVYKLLCESEKAHLAEQEIILSLQNVGVSLVNNITRQEVAFIGITSSNVIWECKPTTKRWWRTLSLYMSALLENSFKQYIDSKPVDKAIIDIEQNFQVSFTPNGLDMWMLQPYKACIRRHFLPSMKVEYSVSPRQYTYRIRVHRIVIQNHLPGAIFSNVFYPIKPPKSVTMDSEPKPLIDVSIITRPARHLIISRIKYFMVLIQEMNLKIDLGFLYAILDLFTLDSTNSESFEFKLLEKDIEYLTTELYDVSASDTSPITHYEYFHISPIKLHLSLSLSTGGDDGKKQKRETELIPVQSLNLLLKSIGASLTDVQDVVFKLNFFEVTSQFYTTQQLQNEVIRHYSKQAIKQMYVLVFGLDVLGNPFGFISGLSAGVGAFFYEPYQGAIQGPEEFVEGMAIGARALFEGAVGGLAGAASRITGALARCIAAVTMDEEYQQKRRQTLNKQPNSFGEGLGRGATGLVSGFVSGFTGLVTKPAKGAQREGAAGFFKGLWQGLVGAIARPTGGIIDMVNSVFQGIKRAAETSQNIPSLRPARFIQEDGVIRPYKEEEGFGSEMLQVVGNGRLAKHEYIAHAKINESNFFMIAKRGIFFVTKDLFGQVMCEWQYQYEDFTKEPIIVDGRRLRIEAKGEMNSVFHSKDVGKIINFSTPEMATWVLAKLEDAREGVPNY